MIQQPKSVAQKKTSLQETNPVIFAHKPVNLKTRIEDFNLYPTKRNPPQTQPRNHKARSETPTTVGITERVEDTTETLSLLPRLQICVCYDLTRAVIITCSIDARCWVLEGGSKWQSDRQWDWERSFEAAAKVRGGWHAAVLLGSVSGRWFHFGDLVGRIRADSTVLFVCVVMCCLLTSGK